MKHLILDIETLSVREDAIILQIAAGIFDTTKKREEEGVESLLENIDFVNYKLNAKIQKDRLVSKSTLEWWKTQPLDVQKASLIPSPEDWDPEAACEDFALWLKNSKFDKRKDTLWQRGTKDSDWLGSLMRDCGWVSHETLPFNWWRVRDLRTAVDVLGQSSKMNGYPDNIAELEGMIPGYQHHDAKCDVEMEFVILRQCGVL